MAYVSVIEPAWSHNRSAGKLGSEKITFEAKGRGDQPMDWTQGERDEGRGDSGNKVHQKVFLHVE